MGAVCDIPGWFDVTYAQRFGSRSLGTNGISVFTKYLTDEVAPRPMLAVDCRTDGDREVAHRRARAIHRGTDVPSLHDHPELLLDLLFQERLQHGVGPVEALTVGSLQQHMRAHRRGIRPRSCEQTHQLVVNGQDVGLYSDGHGLPWGE